MSIEKPFIILIALEILFLVYFVCLMVREADKIYTIRELRMLALNKKKMDNKK